MKTTELNENWEQHKGKLKQKLVELTDDNLLFSADKKDEIYDRLQIVQEKPQVDSPAAIVEL